VNTATEDRTLSGYTKDFQGLD